MALSQGPFVRTATRTSQQNFICIKLHDQHKDQQHWKCSWNDTFHGKHTNVYRAEHDYTHHYSKRQHYRRWRVTSNKHYNIKLHVQKTTLSDQWRHSAIINCPSLATTAYLQSYKLSTQLYNTSVELYNSFRYKLCKVPPATVWLVVLVIVVVVVVVAIRYILVSDFKIQLC